MFQKLIVKFPIKYKIGEKVVSKKTGLPNIGFIVAIEHALFYIIRHNGIKPELCNNLFPDWDSKYIYTLGLDEPVKNLTIEEFNKYKSEGGLKEFDSYADLPSFSFIQYCEDDLESFE